MKKQQKLSPTLTQRYRFAIYFNKHINVWQRTCNHWSGSKSLTSPIRSSSQFQQVSDKLQTHKPEWEEIEEQGWALNPCPPALYSHPLWMLVRPNFGTSLISHVLSPDWFSITNPTRQIYSHPHVLLFFLVFIILVCFICL